MPPVEGTFTVFPGTSFRVITGMARTLLTCHPGDMLQYMTNSYLPSTPHKVGLNTRERYAFAYFHEPNFRSVVKPLEGYKSLTEKADEGIHYGTHFTNMFLRNYPDRITTKKLLDEGRCKLLATAGLREQGA